MKKKYVDESWDFRTADTKQHTHGFHNYPAIMIPQIAGRLIDSYGKKAQLLFDPYCGSGTSLVEASMRGINSAGTDLNPLARLMSRVKSTSINPKLLDNELIKFQDISFSSKLGKVKTGQCKPPAFGNIDYWFDKGVQKKLAFINEFIDDIKNKKICDFFRVAFSGTIRDCSWTRNGEFKLYRMTEKQMTKFNPDVFLIMELKLARMRVGMGTYMDCRNEGATARIYDFDTVVEIPNTLFPKGSVDIVVTSPPYGDSRTTVAYGQFSRLSSEWLNLEGARAVDRSLMGGVPANGNSGKRIKCK